MPHKPVISLSICFIIPLLLAILLHRGYATDWLNQSAHGQLVMLPNSAKQTLGVQLPTGYWHLVWLIHQEQADTWQRADTLHRLRLALGKNQNRVQLHLISKYPLQSMKQQALQQETRFHITTLADLNIPADTLYIVDPHDQIILHFKPHWLAKALYKDLNRLLTVNQGA